MKIVSVKEINSRLSQQQLEQLVKGNLPGEIDSGSLMSGVVRLAWPALAAPQSVMGGDPRYSVTGLYPFAPIDAVTDVLRRALKENYPTMPGLWAQSLDMDNRRSPLKNQGMYVSPDLGGASLNGKSYGGYVPGYAFFRARSGREVPCFRRRLGVVEQVPLEELEKEFYSGCWVNVLLTLIKSSSQANPGVFFALQGVMKLADDSRLGGTSVSSANFANTTSIESPDAAASAPGRSAMPWD